MENSSQEETETLNVLVSNGSIVGPCTLDLFAPPKLTSEIIQLPTLEPKRFMRDLHTGKIQQICVLVTEDDYVAEIRSAVIFAENERFSAAHRWTKVSSMIRHGLRDILLNSGSR